MDNEQPGCSSSLAILDLPPVPPLPDETDRREPVKVETLEDDPDDDDDARTVVNMPTRRRERPNPEVANANSTNTNNSPNDDNDTDQGCTITVEIIQLDEDTDACSGRESTATTLATTFEPLLDDIKSPVDDCIIIDYSHLVDEPSNEENQNRIEVYDQDQVQSYRDYENPNDQDPSCLYELTNLPINPPDENFSFQYDQQQNQSFQLDEHNLSFQFGGQSPMSFMFDQISHGSHSDQNSDFQFPQQNFNFLYDRDQQYNENSSYHYDQDQNYPHDENSSYRYNQDHSGPYHENSSYYCYNPNQSGPANNENSTYYDHENIESLHGNSNYQYHQDETVPPNDNSTSYHPDQDPSFQYDQNQQQSFPEDASSYEASASNHHASSLSAAEHGKECFGTEMFIFLHECIEELSKEVQSGPYKDNLRTCLLDLHKAQQIITSEQRKFHQATMRDHHNSHHEYYCDVKRESLVPLVEVKDEVEDGQPESQEA